MKEVRNPKNIKHKKRTYVNSSSIKRRSILNSMRRRKSILASAFDRMRTARTRRQMVETVNSLANRLGKIKLSPVRMTPAQVRSFYTIAKPTMKRELQKVVRDVGRAGSKSWHNLPSRFSLGQAAIRHYRPNRIREGLIEPNQFNVVYRMAPNNRQKQYNNAVTQVIKTYVRQVNKKQYEGTTPSMYRRIYGRIKNVSNFSNAFKAWEASLLKSSNMTNEQKNAKYRNLIQRLRGVKVLSSTAFTNLNNRLENYHGTLPERIQKLLPIKEALVNKNTGEWNKNKAVRLLKIIHEVQKSRRT